MTDCIFCKIIKGEIPCSKIYENNKIIAFLDIAPVHAGHTLVVPKKHCLDITDISDGSAKDVMLGVKKVSNAIIKALNADGLTVTMNNKEAAGQIVAHAHVHVIPRFKGDGLKLWPQHQYEGGKAEETRDKIVKFL